MLHGEEPGATQGHAILGGDDPVGASPPGMTGFAQGLGDPQSGRIRYIASQCD